MKINIWTTFFSNNHVQKKFYTNKIKLYILGPLFKRGQNVMNFFYIPIWIFKKNVGLKNLFVRIINHFRKNILWHNLVNYKRVMWLLHDTWYESYTRLKLSHVYVCMYVCDNKCSEGINKFIEQLCHLHFIIINFEYIISSAVMNF